MGPYPTVVIAKAQRGEPHHLAYVDMLYDPLRTWDGKQWNKPTPLSQKGSKPVMKRYRVYWKDGTQTIAIGPWPGKALQQRFEGYEWFSSLAAVDLAAERPREWDGYRWVEAS